MKKTDNNTHRLAILKTVDEAVRFTLHAMCLAPIGDGQAGDRAAKMIVERVAERMPSASPSRPPAEDKEIDQLERTFRHTHVAGEGKNLDWCKTCGMNFRDPIHIAVLSLPPSRPPAEADQRGET